jgi:hypothetical protein
VPLRCFDRGTSSRSGPDRHGILSIIVDRPVFPDADPAFRGTSRGQHPSERSAPAGHNGPRRARMPFDTGLGFATASRESASPPLLCHELLTDPSCTTAAAHSRCASTATYAVNTMFVRRRTFPSRHLCRFRTDGHIWPCASTTFQCMLPSHR